MNNDSGSIPQTPPTQPGQLAIPPQKKTWPTVIGILSLIIGAGGFLAQLYAIIIHFLTDQSADNGNPFQNPEGFFVPVLIGNILGCCLAVFLIYASIKLIQRFHAAASHIKWWAKLKIIHALIGTVVGAFVAIRLMQDDTSEVDFGNTAMGESFIMIIIVFGVFVSLLWSLAWPVFILFWMNRAASLEEIETWCD